MFHNDLVFLNLPNEPHNPPTGKLVRRPSCGQKRPGSRDQRMMKAFGSLGFMKQNR